MNESSNNILSKIQDLALTPLTLLISYCDIATPHLLALNSISVPLLWPGYWIGYPHLFYFQIYS